MSTHRPADQSERPIVVLLGASNMSRSLATMTTLIPTMFDGPVELHAAIGHGRSYGKPSRVLARGIGGILESNLWPALAQRRAEMGAPVYALMTDIGNDIAYGVDAPTLLGWIDEAASRLAAINATTVMTRLPLESLDRLHRAQFEIAKTLFFGRRPLTLDQAQATSRAVDEGLDDIAARHNAHLVAQQRAWYGLDPIHIQRRAWRRAWPTVLQPWIEQDPCVEHGDGAPALQYRFAPLRWLAMATWWPGDVTVFGVRTGRTQPTARFRDGTTLSMY